MKKIIVKTISLVLLSAVNMTAVTAAGEPNRGAPLDSVLRRASVPVVFSSVPRSHSAGRRHSSPDSVSQVAKNPRNIRICLESPDALRRSWVLRYQDTEHFALMNHISETNKKGIESLRDLGADKEFKDFIPDKVSNAYAATDFLTNALPLVGNNDGKIRADIIHSLDSLLIIKSAKLRPATAAERAINLRATVEIAKSGRYGDDVDTFEHWEKFFKRSHQTFTHMTTIMNTLNTRAIAAAWFVAENRYRKQYTNYTLAYRDERLEAIRRASNMSPEMFERFIKEIQSAIGDKQSPVSDTSASKPEANSTPVVAPAANKANHPLTTKEAGLYFMDISVQNNKWWRHWLQQWLTSKEFTYPKDDKDETAFRNSLSQYLKLSKKIEGLKNLDDKQYPDKKFFLEIPWFGSATLKKQFADLQYNEAEESILYVAIKS